METKRETKGTKWGSKGGPKRAMGTKRGDQRDQDQGLGPGPGTGTGTRDQGPGSRDQGTGSREQGPGTREQGPGTRDAGPETRDQGPGARGQGPRIIFHYLLRKSKSLGCESTPYCFYVIKISGNLSRQNDQIILESIHSDWSQVSVRAGGRGRSP